MRNVRRAAPPPWARRASATGEPYRVNRWRMRKRAHFSGHGRGRLLRASGIAFEALKLAGVGSLAALAVAPWTDRAPMVVDPSRAPRSTGRIVLSAILANPLNPKRRCS